jgi:menaquinone-dependent protoporphyrinogen IX oxidase
MSIIVGLMTCTIALFQSFMAAYGFDTKASHHLQAADMYDQILTMIDLEKSYPSNNNFFKDLERDLSKIKSNCPYLVPTFIKKTYYKKKDKRSYQSFVKKMIIQPGRKELIESVLSGNINMNINDNLDYIQSRMIEINKLENTLMDINPNQKREFETKRKFPTLKLN